MRRTVRLTRVVDELLEQGRLADARLPAHHHAAGGPVPRLLEERGQRARSGSRPTSTRRPYYPHGRRRPQNPAL